MICRERQQREALIDRYLRAECLSAVDLPAVLLHTTHTDPPSNNDTHVLQVPCSRPTTAQALLTTQTRSSLSSASLPAYSAACWSESSGGTASRCHCTAATADPRGAAGTHASRCATPRERRGPLRVLAGSMCCGWRVQRAEMRGGEVVRARGWVLAWWCVVWWVWH